MDSSGSGENGVDQVQDIILEFPEFEETHVFSKAKGYSLIGLETANPILKIDDFVFQGVWEEYVGTALLFKPADASANNTDKQYRYFAETTKKIRFTRVVVEKKQKEPPSLESEAMVADHTA